MRSALPLSTEVSAAASATAAVAAPEVAPSGGQESYMEEVTLDFLFFYLSFFPKVLAGGDAAPQPPLVLFFGAAESDDPQNDRR